MTKTAPVADSESSAVANPFVNIYIKGAIAGDDFILYSHSQTTPVTNGTFKKPDFALEVDSRFTGPARIKVVGSHRTREVFAVNFSRDFYLEDGAVIKLDKDTEPVLTPKVTPTAVTKTKSPTTSKKLITNKLQEEVQAASEDTSSNNSSSKTNFWDRFK